MQAIRIDPETVNEVSEHGFWVYVLWGSDSEVPLYIGQSKRLRQRLRWHMSNPDKRKLIRHIEIIACADAHEMNFQEWAMIRECRPTFNSRGAEMVPELGGWGSDGTYTRIDYEHGLSYYDIEVLSRPILPPISISKPIVEIPAGHYYAVMAAVTWLRALCRS